jgi:lactoylglutathione lyase
MVEFTHAIIFVNDMVRSVAFYRDVLGLHVRFETPKWTEFDTSFAVDDLDAFHQELIAKGVRCLQPPEVEDFGGKLAGYADPDGLPFWVGEKSGKSG